MSNTFWDGRAAGIAGGLNIATARQNLITFPRTAPTISGAKTTDRLTQLSLAERGVRIHPVRIAPPAPAGKAAERCLPTEAVSQAPVDAVVVQRLRRFQQGTFQRLSVGDSRRLRFAGLVVSPRRGAGIVDQLDETLYDIPPPRRPVPVLVGNPGL